MVQEHFFLEVKHSNIFYYIMARAWEALLRTLLSNQHCYKSSQKAGWKNLLPRELSSSEIPRWFSDFNFKH